LGPFHKSRLLHIHISSLRVRPLFEVFIDHTFGTPNPCYQVGRLVESSTNGKCSGNGRRANCQSALSNNEEAGSLTLQIPHATVHSSLVAEAWFAWHSIPSRKLDSISFRQHRGNLQRSMMWFLQIAQLSTTISQAHKATAFHCGHISTI
jgi:hypothetical protein